MQRGTEITEAKAKINSRSSTESNNNVPEQGATDSRRGELERGFPPSPSLQQISQTEHRLHGSLCFRAGGCCSILGWIWTWLRDYGPFRYQLSGDPRLSSRDQKSSGILFSKALWGRGRKGSTARLPAEPAWREAEKQLDALASGEPTPGLLAQNSRILGEFGHRTWGAQGCRYPGHITGFESLAHGLLGHQDLAPCCVAGSSRDLISFCGQSMSIKHYLFA